MIVIGIAGDHAGFHLKSIVFDHLKEKGYQVIDFGCNSDLSCDYTEFAHLLGKAIDNKLIDFGFVFCGSGNGINITVNKHQMVRSALCWSSEIASLSRHHNNANVCSLPARFVTSDVAINIVDTFLFEPFDGGRHLQRVLNIPIVI